jgi:drug/metabolite transporter (DMT)-like permease
MSHRAKVWVALLTVYVIWGSTYLGIEMTGETIPPLLAVGVRFICAALLLGAFTWWRRGRGAFRVRRRELLSAILVGALLPGANAVLFVAELYLGGAAAA